MYWKQKYYQGGYSCFYNKLYYENWKNNDKKLYKHMMKWYMEFCMGEIITTDMLMEEVRRKSRCISPNDFHFWVFQFMRFNKLWLNNDTLEVWPLFVPDRVLRLMGVDLDGGKGEGLKGVGEKIEPRDDDDDDDDDDDGDGVGDGEGVGEGVGDGMGEGLGEGVGEGMVDIGNMGGIGIWEI